MIRRMDNRQRTHLGIFTLTSSGGGFHLLVFCQNKNSNNRSIVHLKLNSKQISRIIRAQQATHACKQQAQVKDVR
jgi:hypothetical protein